MEITKNHIIKSVIIVLCCVASFCIGRYTRIGRISGTSEQLISGIVLERDRASEILDQLGIAKSAIKSSDDYGRLITEGITQLQQSNEVGRICIDEVIRSIEDSELITKNFYESYSELFGTADFAFGLAILKSEEYERIIDSFREIADNTPEDYKESKSRHKNSNRKTK